MRPPSQLDRQTEGQSAAKGANPRPPIISLFIGFRKAVNMAGQDLNALKGYLRDYTESITQRSNSGLYVCPLCGSGTGAHKTGAFSIDKSGERWRCFGCNEHGDVYDLVSHVENVTPSEAAKIVMDRYGSAATQTGYRRSTAAEDFNEAEQRPAPEETQIGVFADAIARYSDALEGSPAQSYLQGRGLTVETMKRFKLGYDAAKQTVTIPYNAAGSYYGQRSVNPRADRKHDNLKGVQMPLFNAGALYSSPVVFVVESPLCAISIAQEGGAAVAISGTGGKSRLIDQLKKKPTAAALVLCLDNDDAGRKAAADIDAALVEMDVFHVDGTAAIMGTEADPAKAEYRKDPNEVLQKSGAAELKAAISETVEATTQARQAVEQEAEQERQQRTGAGMVDSFLQAVQSEKYKPMPTGIRDIDRALYGGFMRQQLVILGAAPGAGKTALAQWIFEGMAQQGITSCVYLNLEMSREQVLARSLSRMAARQGTKVNALEIMQGYKWTDTQRAAIMAAAEEYKGKIAPRMIYNPDGITADLDAILAYLESEAQRAEKTQQPAPVVVLDYLQLITGQPREDAATVIKRAVAGLKGYAIRHDTLVFIIIAHNRQSNSTGAVSMEAARDTSAIEYSADLQLALTFTGCLKRDGQKAKTPEELTPEERRNITLRIVKGRFGGMGTDVDLHFDGGTMTYTQTCSEFIEVNEPTPFDEPTQGKRRQVRF